ncbi:MAG TPA: hypothetical protein VFI31_17125 [Pirellulales bacterium]|nr:hypothetical protein [Pirellulales bacterium]
MEENPYESPVEFAPTSPKSHFTVLKWYTAVACVAIATFVAFWVVAYFVAG